MHYAFVEDVAASWEQYESYRALTVEPSPSGLIVLVAGPTDEGIRIICVWESEEAWLRFKADRLDPAIAALGGPARPQPTFRDLRAAHVVFPGGPATAGAATPTPSHKEEQCPRSQ